MKSEELLAITSADSPIPYRWAIGLEGSRFLAELRDNKRFMGIRCPQCRRVYVPPRKVCGPCFAAMNDWVELGDEGVLVAFSNVNYRFIDPSTGKERPVPYIYGYIALDGADTKLSHVIQASDLAKLQPGSRVKAVFREHRTASLQDILYFEVLG